MKRPMRKPSSRRVGPMSVRAWLSIRVELVEGRGVRYWPRPGRLFAAAKSHTYGQLATAIDDAFARWDRSHLHEFELTDGTRIGIADPELGDEGVLDETRENFSLLETSQQFIYCPELNLRERRSVRLARSPSSKPPTLERGAGPHQGRPCFQAAW